MADLAVASPAQLDGAEPQSRNCRGQVKHPKSGQSSVMKYTTLSDEVVAKGNPFKMPQDNDIFILRDKERQRKKEERKLQRGLRVHEKTTYATRINLKSAKMIRPADSDSEGEKSDEDDGKSVAVKDDPQFTLAVTRDRHVEKESLADYINKKREMFLVQYSLGVKRDEMRKLEEIAAAEEKKLELAEQFLEEDAAMFDEFLKENDKNSVEAIKIAEAETKAKLEKVAEIKKIHAQMMAIKSEICKYEDALKEYQLYKDFLDDLTPKEWLDEKHHTRLEKQNERHRDLKSVDKRLNTPADSEKSVQSRSSKKSLPSGPKKRSASKLKSENRSFCRSDSRSDYNRDDVVPMSVDHEDSDEELVLYFTDPQQLLDMFAELEEQNLSLIQNSQETEEALEEMKQMIKVTKRKMEKETDVLRDQIDKLNNAITSEEEKAKDLEMKAKLMPLQRLTSLQPPTSQSPSSHSPSQVTSIHKPINGAPRLFSYGEFQAEDQEKMLLKLNRKVEDVYRSCIGDNEANISTLQMLTNIENRLEELFEQVEMMPQDKVEMAEKAKEKERRLSQREDKMEQQKLHQEERVRRALERAKADPKKPMGRKLVGRSEPPRLARKQDDGADLASKEEEELAYYFQ